MYGPNEIDATKRVEPSETLARAARTCVHERSFARAPAHSREFVRARVCFFNEIYYRTPNAPGHEERVLPLFPPIDSHPALTRYRHHRRQRRRRRRPRRHPRSRRSRRTLPSLRPLRRRRRRSRSSRRRWPLSLSSSWSSVLPRRHFVPSRRAVVRLRAPLNPRLPRYYELIYIPALTRASGTRLRFGAALGRHPPRPLTVTPRSAEISKISRHRGQRKRILPRGDTSFVA